MVAKLAIIASRVAVVVQEQVPVMESSFPQKFLDPSKVLRYVMNYTLNTNISPLQIYTNSSIIIAIK